MEWNHYAIARAVHVLGVVLWIGGVAMVTTVLLPAIARHIPLAGQYAMFEAIEQRFAWQARWTTQLVGASGLLMLWLTDGWARLATTGWLHAMLFTYALFTLMLFVLEPFVLHRLLAAQAAAQSSGHPAPPAAHALAIAHSQLADRAVWRGGRAWRLVSGSPSPPPARPAPLWRNAPRAPAGAAAAQHRDAPPARARVQSACCLPPATACLHR